MVRTLFILAISLWATACGPRIISGTVMDRNGNPVDRALVRIEPGNVELVTDSTGYFQVDYLRDETGERTKLDARTDYTFEVFKPGYHLYGSDLIYYKRGEVLLEPITLNEDTIRVVGSESNIDPEQYPDRTHSAGASYEGE